MKKTIYAGTVFQELRNQKGISQEEIAHRANLERTFISMLERETRLPSLKTVFALAKALEMRPSEVVKVIEEDPINEQFWINLE